MQTFDSIEQFSYEKSQKMIVKKKKKINKDDNINDHY